MVKKMSVIGPGTMGTGITQAFLQAGFEVVLIGTSEGSLKKGVERLSASLDKAIAKGSLKAEDKNAMLQSLTTSSEYSSVAGSVLIVEAVPEVYEIKSEVLSKLEPYSKGAIIATNTSSIPITKLAVNLKDKSRFIGLHFFNPVPVMKPVELVETEYTSEETKKVALELASEAGKTAIEVNDYPGFVANSVLMPFLNEAALLLQKNVATKEGIDQIVKLGLHHPMGPLELADFIGIDVCVDIMEAIYAETKDEKFNPVELLVRMKKEGKLGKKSGEGFYKY